MIAHLPLISGLCAGFIAQLLKFFAKLIREHKVDFRTLVTTGGMPSSHSALVVGLTTSVGLTQGWDSPLFDVALVFSFIVMYDAAGVRRAAGRQAKVLNEIVSELQHDFKVSFPRLQELLGHTPREVVGGALLGVAIGLLAHQYFA